MRRSATIAVTLLVAITLTAQAEVTEIQWDSKGRFEKTTVLQAGKLTELCGKLTKGQKVNWSFKSDGPLSFNIHFHEGESVEYPVKQSDIAVAEGVLDVSKQQEYCWMWSNKGKDRATLTVALAR